MTNKLSESQLDEIVDTIHENSSPVDRDTLNDIKESLQNNNNTLEDYPAVVYTTNSGNITTMEDTDKEHISILNIMKPNNELETELSVNSIKEHASSNFELTDDEAETFLNVLLRYKFGEKFNIYKELPEKVQSTIRQMAFENNISILQYQDLTKFILDQIIEESKMDDIFIDFERSIKAAMKMPSVSDIYMNHIKEVMTKNTLELADNIEKEEPEKAMMLRKVSEYFVYSYTLEKIKESFDTIGRVRKAVRRDYDKYKKYCSEVNFKNEKSIFKFNDAESMYPALKKVLIDDKEFIDNINLKEIDIEELKQELDVDAELSQLMSEMDYNKTEEEREQINTLIEKHRNITFTENDIKKLIVLICKTFENLDSKDTVDASYMYYCIKNISALNNTEEAKTLFATELIYNIKELIIYINEQEEKFKQNNKK